MGFIKSDNPVLMQAVVTDPASGALRLIHAEKAKNPGLKAQFSCAHCLSERGIVTPLRLISGRENGMRAGGCAATSSIWGQRRGADTRGYSYLDRFELQDAAMPHVCSHPVRFSGIEGLAADFMAQKIAPHAYQFVLPEMLQQPRTKADTLRLSRHIKNFAAAYAAHPIETMADVKRLITVFARDPRLLQTQKITVRAQGSEFDVNLYDHNGRSALIQKAFTNRLKNTPVYAVCIFKPVDRSQGKLWHAYQQLGQIPGLRGHSITIKGEEVHTGIALDCGPGAYEAVREILAPEGIKKTTLALVFGRVSAKMPEKDGDPFMVYIHVPSVHHVVPWKAKENFTTLKDRKPDLNKQKLFQHMLENA